MSLDKSKTLTTERTCAECFTQLEVFDFDRRWKDLPELVQLYCPKCKAGCGMIETSTIVKELFLH